MKDVGELPVVALARREGRPSVIHSSADVVGVINGWVASTADLATRFCAEVLPVLGRARTLKPRTLLYAGPDYWRTMGFQAPGPPWRDRVTGPVSLQANSAGWTVQLWAVEPGQLTEYECTLRPGQSLMLVTIDSLPGAGVPPYDP